jgi:hypothetical protein
MNSASHKSKIIKKLKNEISSLQKYKNILEEEKKGKLCVICLKNPSIFCTIPCGHLCICFSCSLQYKKQFYRCPLCRTDIQNILRIQGIPTNEIIKHEYKTGDTVLAQWINQSRRSSFNYKGTIKQVHNDGTIHLVYEDGMEIKKIHPSNIKRKLTQLENVVFNHCGNNSLEEIIEEQRIIEENMRIPPAPAPAPSPINIQPSSLEIIRQ